MDTAILVGIITAVATVLAAWLTISRQSKRKSEVQFDIYRRLCEILYEVRNHASAIRSLLANDPTQNFVKDIVNATNAFREACDSLQSFVGANRALINKNAYSSVVSLIDISSDLIETIRRRMANEITADEFMRDIPQLGNFFTDRLIKLEDIIRQNIQRI